MTLAGKHYWLVGASAGIGEALALQLAKAGAKLALSARNEAALQSLHGRLQGEGHLVLLCDVTNAEAVAEAWQAIQKQWPQLDGMVYLAGIYTPMGVAAFDVQECLRTTDINLNGLYRVLHHCLPDMLARKAGHLVLFGSVAGYRGLPKAMAYGASKAAINVLAETLAIELPPLGVKVQLVSPGFVATRLTDKNDFSMPFRITAEQAAAKVVAGMQSSAFEIHFPKAFTYVMKLLRYLPNRLYLWIGGRL